MFFNRSRIVSVLLVPGIAGYVECLIGGNVEIVPKFCHVIPVVGDQAFAAVAVHVYKNPARIDTLGDTGSGIGGFGFATL